MASKLKIYALGGLNEIGKNLYCYEYGNDILIVDCGMGFPDDEMYGIDSVIPDVSWLASNRKKLRAIVLTHGHEDHIGALPYVLEALDCKVPVYATRLTVALAELKLAEHKLLEKSTLITLEAGEHFRAGCFDVELIHVNHSIPDAVALAITTPLGVVIQTGDFKIDVTPIQGEMIDLARLGALGKQGVLALLADSTNVERPGHSDSESVVGDRFDQLFKGCDKRIIVTTFASNVHRIQQIINCAARYKRKVGITGRSMENVIRVSRELGYLDIPDGVLMDMNQIKGQPKKDVVIITTGSQGENMSALYRMAFSGHRQVEIDTGDRVIISASAIPGNETTISRVINELFFKGAEVIYDRLSNLHVSGHACQEELKMMLALTKPKYFIPVHGEQRHLQRHAELAKSMGVAPRNVVVTETGRVVEISAKSIKLGARVPCGQILVDGSGVGEVGSVVLRDRQHLADEGMIVVVMALSSEDGSLISAPDIITRGFVYVKESEDLLAEMRRVVMETIDGCRNHRITDWASIKGKVKSNLSGYIYRTTKRSPMILPVITEI
ncbi:MAG: ribonuclease J [Oscillospiraceae bacterium]|nr:ribonuclease J [Oscillospiraceae bacterium]